MKHVPSLPSIIIAGLCVAGTMAASTALAGPKAQQIQTSTAGKQNGTTKPARNANAPSFTKGSGQPGGMRGASLAAAAQILASRATDGYNKPVLGQGKASGRFSAVMPRTNKVVVKETHAPGLVSTYVFKGAFWGTTFKPFRLVQMLLPMDLSAAPSNDPAFLNNGLTSPGADAPFEVMSIGEGVKRKEAYRRAHQRAQQTGNSVIFRHNKRIYTVTRQSPPTLGAYEKSGVSVPELGIDL